jgi:hypothetical protein
MPKKSTSPKLWLGRIVLILLAVAALDGGVKLRQWIWDECGQRNIRFHGDLLGAWYRGGQVLHDARLQNAYDGKQPDSPISPATLFRGYLVRFDRAMVEKPNGTYDVDYPPARLLIMSIWVWTTGHPPDIKPEEAELLAAPLLKLNAGFELAAAIAAFLTVRLVLRRRGGRACADWLGFAAALLVWFNPAMILDAHVWPQWDVWAVPFYLLAAWLGLSRRWLLCGLCLGLGGMFKGQILLVMPIFVLWPLFQLEIRAALNVISGILCGAMLYVAPWMIRTVPAAICLTVILAAAGACHVFIPALWRKTYTCGIIGGSILLSGAAFHGTFAWWWVGFAYGVRHRLQLTIRNRENLAAIISRYHWKLLDTAFTVHNFDVTIRMILIAMYVIALVLCAWGAARQDLRNDRRVLIALATPWVALFAFLPQMHERYLIWGAGITAIMVGVSFGATLLHLLAAVLGSLPLCYTLLMINNLGPDYETAVASFLQAEYDAAAATVLLALILLYLSVAPSKRSELTYHDSAEPG